MQDLTIIVEHAIWDKSLKKGRELNFCWWQDKHFPILKKWDAGIWKS